MSAQYDLLRPAASISAATKYLSNAPRWQVFEKTLTAVVVLDLGLGGNGYLIQIGGVRLRVFLYFICLGWALARLTKIEPVRLPRFIWALLAAFALITAVDTGIGIASGFTREVLFAELKPLSYFPMILFFAVAIRTREDVVFAAGLIIASGITVAIAYLALLAVTHAGLVDYRPIFATLVASDEFIFRHNPLGPFVGFLYKGMFYACIAALLLSWRTDWPSILLTILCLVAVAMTITRGLCISIAVCMVAAIVLTRKWRRIPLMLAYIVILFGVVAVAQKAETKLLISFGDIVVPKGEKWRIGADGKVHVMRDGKDVIIATRTIRDAADNVRAEDAKFVYQSLSPRMFAIGYGIGAPIRGRERVEVNYLEILYKQGLPGLAIWGALALYLCFLYGRVRQQAQELALPLLLCGLFVYVVTTFNTFLTGSIGMAVVFIATASLIALSRSSQPTTESPSA